MVMPRGTAALMQSTAVFFLDRTNLFLAFAASRRSSGVRKVRRVFFLAGILSGSSVVDGNDDIDADAGDVDKSDNFSTEIIGFGLFFCFGFLLFFFDDDFRLNLVMLTISRNLDAGLDFGLDDFGDFDLPDVKSMLALHAR